MKRMLFIGVACLLSACASTGANRQGRKPKGPTASSNACTLFHNHPNWYWEALNTYNRWGVPISVQMAIMQRESDFQAGAKPLSGTTLGFIPWGNITSAYGYAQAVDGSWSDYQHETKRYNTQRDKFGDASDFVGWYCNKANKKLGIPLNNTYELYLAYHEGLVGYAHQSYANKPWLLDVANTVQNRANQYRIQIGQCKYALPR